MYKIFFLLGIGLSFILLFTTQSFAAQPLVASVSKCGNPSITESRKIQLKSMECYLNTARMKSGLKALTLNKKLSRSAKIKSKDTFKCEFSHTACGRESMHWVFKVNYLEGSSRWNLGENLAWGSSYLGKPRRILIAWLRSPGHRKNILSPVWRDHGIGLHQVKKNRELYAQYWTHHMGAR